MNQKMNSLKRLIKLTTISLYKQEKNGEDSNY